MPVVPRAVVALIESFESLPGIGPKTAQRLTYHLLHAPQEVAQNLADALLRIKKEIVVCQICFNISEKTPCVICEDLSRNQKVIMVVEDPLDVLAFERTNFDGLYHVLGGRIAPLEGIGPDELRIKELLPRVQNGVVEVILATNPNMEGDATAMYIERLLSPLVKVTKIGRGLPVGGDVEYADDQTLMRSLENRG